MSEQGIIHQEYIKDLEDKVKECEDIIERHKGINIRIITNYEYLDQKYDKIYSLLTEEQKLSLD